MSQPLRAPLVIVLALFAGACWSRTLAQDGTCSADVATPPGCIVAGDGGASATLVGYGCTGAARPDDSPTYASGVPQGLVCADEGAIAGGMQGYCCTPQTTACALDPALECDPTAHGYQCRGGNRPESLNPALTCTQGIMQGDYVDYCCFNTPQMAGCQQSDSVSCSPRLLGWTCLGTNLPLGQELGANKSRADSYNLVCPTATPAANPAFNNYCCYEPALVPAGGSCVPDTVVPGCAPGRFGFACYGRDTPDQDYLPMHCPSPGSPGIDAEGYAATLYCCDFQ